MKAIVLLCIVVTYFGVLTAPAHGANLGLAGAWLFDEGAGNKVKDSVGNNDGEIEGDLNWVNGKFGKALEFPGKGDCYVSIPYNAVFDSDPYTITAWVKLEQTTWQYIAWQNGLTWPEAHKKRHLDIWVHKDGYVVIMWMVDGGADYARIDGKTIITDGKWHHVAMSSNGKTMRLLIDGAVEGELDLGGNLVKNGEDALWIGARPGDVAATGVIDEVGFFSSALSETELKDVMSQGLAAFAPVEPMGKMALTWGSTKE